MKNEITHPTAVRLLKKVISCIPERKSGTYNAQDPTAFESGQIITTIDGFQRYEIEYFDCTWGIELTISEIGTYSDQCRELGSFYLEAQRKRINDEWVNVDVIIPRQGFWGLLILLYKLSRTLCPIPRKDEPDWQEHDGFVDVSSLGGDGIAMLYGLES